MKQNSSSLTRNLWTIFTDVLFLAPLILTLTPQSALAQTDVVSINSAGPAVSNSGGGDNSFVADEDYSGGTASSFTAAVSTTAAAAAAAPMAVYQTQRFGNFTYTIPGLTAGDNYTVRLHFSEGYWDAAGKRIFDVSINGTQVLTNFDIFATAGGMNIAVVEQFTATANSSGQIVVVFTTVTDNAALNGIEILSGAPCTMVASAPTGVTATAGSSSSITLSWTAVTPPANCTISSYSVYSSTGTLIASGVTGTTYTVTGLSASTAYSYYVEAVDSEGASAASATASATTEAASSCGTDVLDINSAGPAISGTSWVADEDYTGGTASSFTTAVNTSKVTCPAPAAVYLTQRYGNFTYTIPGLTAGDNYTVRLHFSEGYFDAAGDRTADISINGTQVLTNFDIFATAGGENIAVIEQFTTTANSSGEIVIQFVSVVNNAAVNGIEIQTSPTAACAAVPSPPTGLTATAGSSSSITLSWTAVTPPANCTISSYNVYSSTGTLIASGVTGTTYTVTGLEASTAYSYYVEAVDSEGASAASATASATTLASTTCASADVLDINSAGPAISGTSWVADEDYSGGTASSFTAAVNTANVTCPAPMAVYQTQRFGNFTYTIPGLTAGANYEVRLHFSEGYFDSAGSREANISINGTQVLTNFDIFATAGAENTAVIEQFEEPANSSGQMVITFTSVVNNAAVNGIEIETAAPCTAVPSAPTGLTATATSSSSIALSWTAVTPPANCFLGSYSVYSSTGTLIASGLTGTTYTVTGLSASTTYSYYVVAIDSYGTSADSATASATTPAGSSGTGSCAGVANITVGGVTYTPQWCQFFTGPAGPPSSTVFAYDLGGGGWGNGEAEVYCGPPGYSGNPAGCPTTFSTTTNPIYIDGNGHLVIQPLEVDGTWYSARLKTEGITYFGYGILEATMELPNTINQGLWPAFWGLGEDFVTGTAWPTCGETDIMENWSPQVDSGPGTTGNCSTIHTELTGGDGIGKCYTLPSGEATNTAFHTYGIVWTENEMQFFIDDINTPYFTATPSILPSGDIWPFNQNIFMITNVAVGGTLGGSITGLTSPASPLLVQSFIYYAP